MTPGWAEIGAEMVIKELRLDRVAKYGKDPLDMARRLFTHYKRGLYISTGVGDEEHALSKAWEFCADFNLALECTSAEPTLSGPAPYCLIYDVTSEWVELISLWHGRGSRNAGHMTRIWVKGYKLEQKV